MDKDVSSAACWLAGAVSTVAEWRQLPVVRVFPFGEDPNGESESGNSGKDFTSPAVFAPLKLTSFSALPGEK